MTTLIILNKEVEDIVKWVKYLKGFGLLIKDLSDSIENDAKEQKQGFRNMLLGKLGASLLENLLAGKDSYASDGVILAGEGTISAGGTAKT